MIQAVRFYLRPGCTGTFQTAGRALVYDSFEAVTEPPANMEPSALWNENTVITNSVDPSFSPLVAVPPPTGNVKGNTNQGYCPPWYDPVEENWEYAYVDFNDIDEQGLYGLVPFKVILNQNPTYTSAMLDPMQEPTWTNSGFLPTGEWITSHRNIKTVQVVINTSLTSQQWSFGPADCGKYGWLSAGHGPVGTPNSQLDWGPFQYLNFLRNRIALSPGQ